MTSARSGAEPRLVDVGAAVERLRGFSSTPGGSGGTNQPSHQIGARPPLGLMTMFHTAVSWMLVGGFAVFACSAKNDNAETTLASTESTNGISTSGDGLACTWDEPRGSCEAKRATCLYRPAGEIIWEKDACTGGPEPVGWCVEIPTGQTDSPSWWVEVATGRVFTFPVGPFVGPAGWERCSCEAPAAQACMCDDACSPGGDSTSSEG